MIVETGQEVQRLTRNLMEYLGVLKLSPRTYGFWARFYASGGLVPPPPKLPSPESVKLEQELRAEMRKLQHRLNCTRGLDPLYRKYQGRIQRKKFREMAREVHEEVKRERRKNILRYEFTARDVCYAMDYTRMPAEFPGAVPHRYLLVISDEASRFAIKKVLTEQKGAGLGARVVQDLLRSGKIPLVFKYDREFDVPQFEALLIANKVVPMPSPRNYPKFNGKVERTNRDIQAWLGTFASDNFWTYDELSQELDRCFEELNDLYEREVWGGRSRRVAYEEMKAPHVGREEFFATVDTLRRQIMNRAGRPVHPADAWRVATKETLKKYGLVTYSRP